MLSIKTSDFPGANRPEVTPLLRAMLYVLLDSPAQRMDLRREIIDKLAGRELIPIQQKLLSHIELIQQEPYLFAPCVDTQSLLAYYKKFAQIADSDTAANVGADPVSNLGVGAAAAKFLTQAAAGLSVAALQLINYFGGKSKDYYQAYAQRMREELAARGYALGQLG